MTLITMLIMEGMMTITITSWILFKNGSSQRTTK